MLSGLRARSDAESLLAVEGGPVGSLCAGPAVRWPPRVRARRDFKEGSELAACNTLVRSLGERWLFRLPLTTTVTWWVTGDTRFASDSVSAADRHRSIRGPWL